MVLPHTVSVLPTVSNKLNRKKIIRITTVPLSLDIFCRGLLKELSEEYDVLAVSSPGPLLDKVAEREGVRTVAVPMERRPSPVKDLKALARLTRLFREERPDMVHSMTPKAGLLSMAAARLAGVLKGWYLKLPTGSRRHAPPTYWLKARESRKTSSPTESQGKG